MKNKRQYPQMPPVMPFYGPGYPPAGPFPGMIPVPGTAPGAPYAGAIPYPGAAPAPGAVAPGEVYVPGLLPLEQSYIENILRLNLGKMATIYMTFENNPQWNAKVFRGRLEAAGRDHIIISDPATGKRYLLLMVNLDYVEFDEPLQYFYPVPPLSPPIPPR
ncbi:hypothetical protein BSNK01_31540 [Bacillaceae bacterium]